jgi:transmembrane protein 126A
MPEVQEFSIFSFTLRAGPGILGGIAALSSFAVNNHFRYKLKLGTYGRMSSYLSVVCIPAVISMLFHATVSE